MSRPYLEYHPVFAHRFVPGIRARVPSEAGGYFVRANGLGFRSEREFARERTPGLQRVLAFGDSFTAGDGVSNSQRYTDVLEGLLDGVEVYNFGLPGTGPDQHYLAYREYAADMDCDLLLLAPLAENIRRVVAHHRIFLDGGEGACYAKPYYELGPGDDLILRNVPPSPDPVRLDDLPPSERKHVDLGGRFAAARQIVNALGAKELALKLTSYQPLPEYASSDNPAWRVLRAILLRWIKEHQEIRGPVLLAPIPFYHYVEEISDGTAFVTRFRELAASAGCAFHDMLPDLQAYPAAERRRFRFEKDVHLTPAGHAAVAASLAPAVRAALALNATHAFHAR